MFVTTRHLNNFGDLVKWKSLPPTFLTMVFSRFYAKDRTRLSCQMRGSKTATLSTPVSPPLYKSQWVDQSLSFSHSQQILRTVKPGTGEDPLRRQESTRFELGSLTHLSSRIFSTPLSPRGTRSRVGVAYDEGCDFTGQAGNDRLRRCSSILSTAR